MTLSSPQLTEMIAQYTFEFSRCRLVQDPELKTYDRVQQFLLENKS